MRFMVYSRFSSETIGSAFGEPEYSYYFVLKEFVPLLQTLGAVDIVSTETEANDLYESWRKEGDACLFLNFTAPHNSARDTKCPVVPVFAWEFSTIPTDTWHGDGYNNWKLVLQKHGAAITHSRFTVAAVKSALGEEFPIISIPAPVWDRCEKHRLRTRHKRNESYKQRQLLEFFGVVCDSKDIDFDHVVKEHLQRPDGSDAQDELPEPEFVDVDPPEIGPGRFRKTLRMRFGTFKNLLVQMYRECVADILPYVVRRGISRLYAFLRPAYRKVLRTPDLEEPSSNFQSDVVDTSADPPAGENQSGRASGDQQLAEPESTDTERKNIVELSGVVYTTLFNPYDGRKNWEAMLTAFCWTFRDTEDVTLLIKVSASQIVFFTDQVVDVLARLRPFKCRIVIIKGFLDDEQYTRLVEASSYYVNTSSGEGQCLPLMEFLSSGIPALAPINTAMADYMSEEVGFVIDSRPELTSWQHDDRRMMRAFHYPVDWMSTMRAFEESYEMIRQNPGAYRAKSDAAIECMKAHCSIDVLRDRLENFLGTMRLQSELGDCGEPVEKTSTF